MEIKNNNFYEEPEQTKGKIWKQFGIFALSLFLSILTILVIYVG